jgi:hypothetical protein
VAEDWGVLARGIVAEAPKRQGERSEADGAKVMERIARREERDAPEVRSATKRLAQRNFASQNSIKN